MYERNLKSPQILLGVSSHLQPKMTFFRCPKVIKLLSPQEKTKHKNCATLSFNVDYFL